MKRLILALMLLSLPILAQAESFWGYNYAATSIAKGTVVGFYNATTPTLPYEAITTLDTKNPWASISAIAGNSTQPPAGVLGDTCPAYGTCAVVTSGYAWINVDSAVKTGYPLFVAKTAGKACSAANNATNVFSVGVAMNATSAGTPVRAFVRVYR